VGTGPAASLDAADYVLTGGTETVGFTGATGTDDDDDPDSTVRIAECVGVTDYLVVDPFDRAIGDTFTSDRDLMIQVDSKVKVVGAEQIARDTRIVTDPGFGACYQRELESQLASSPRDDGTTYEVVAVETPTPPRGATALVRVSMRISAGSGSYGFVFDAVYVYAGQVEVLLDYQNLDNAPPRAGEQAMVDQITAKLARQ
jgi:hypothetical protein